MGAGIIQYDMENDMEISGRGFTSELFALRGAAGEYLSAFCDPWEALEGIGKWLWALGGALSGGFREISRGVWVHERAKIAQSAALAPPCIVCAGAEVVVDRLTDEFLDAVAAKGERVRKALEGAAGISEITGMGLMIGVRTARPVADVLADLRSEGVLALKAHDKLRLLPPLNISDELLDEAVEKIKKVCAK